MLLSVNSDLCSTSCFWGWLAVETHTKLCKASM
jgi:hypothetical protein